MAGSRAARDFIERTKPTLVLCGHIHEARGQTRIGPTLVVNCGPAYNGHHVLIELNDDTCQVDLH
jgi:Icc-related predicted phosphoesterase